MIKQIDCVLLESATEWSKIIQRLAAVDLWPRGQEGIDLALKLIHADEELERRKNDSTSSS